MMLKLLTVFFHHSCLPPGSAREVLLVPDVDGRDRGRLH